MGQAEGDVDCSRGNEVQGWRDVRERSTRRRDLRGLGNGNGMNFHDGRQ